MHITVVYSIILAITLLLLYALIYYLTLRKQKRWEVIEYELRKELLKKLRNENRKCDN